MIFLSVATDKFCFKCVKPTNAFYAAAVEAKIDIRGGALVQQDDPEDQIFPSTSERLSENLMQCSDKWLCICRRRERHQSYFDWSEVKHWLFRKCEKFAAGVNTSVDFNAFF